MAAHLPKPQDVGARIPQRFIKARYEAGFQHALAGGQLNRPEYFRLSFREGFRAGKLYLRELRRQRGVIDFPMRARVKIVSR